MTGTPLSTALPELRESLLGRGLSREFGHALQSLGIENPLLVHSESARERPAIRELLETVPGHETWTSFSAFSPNPQRGELEAGLGLLQAQAVDGIVAIGGGTAMDIAKMLAVLDEGGVDALIANRGGRGQLPVLLVPTTAGSGSEATDFAVLHAEGEKHSISTRIDARFALIDPALSDSMSPELTAACGLDALCQAAESFWARGADPESRGWAREALLLAHGSLAAATYLPDAMTRDAMALAAHLAGRAINRSKTTAPHALSYHLTMKYEVPHGHAVALMFAPALQLTAERGDARALELIELFGFESVESSAEDFLDLVAGLGLETSLTRLGVRNEADREELVAAVNLERLGNHPVALDADDLLAIVNRLR